MSRWLITLLIMPFVAGASVNSRVTSIYLSQDFINEQLKAHVKPGLLRDMKVELDPKGGQIFLRGIVQVPVEELRAVNLDPKLGAFRFQLTIKPEATKEGYLILEFPLNETFFYPASSKTPAQDRVVIPVQMLSLALASARGYFAALSGDFSGFDRREAKFKALIKALNREISGEKNADAREALKNERDAAKLQMEALPIERKQMEALAKEVGGMMGFTGEKELNLNDQLAARKNALVIKINPARFTPYLTGVELGGVRIVHDNKDGPSGENYFSVDINADTVRLTPPRMGSPADQRGLKEPPSAMIRINQALFESELIASAEKKAMGDKLQDLKIELKEDGMHVSGKFHKFFLSIPFDTIVDIQSDEIDTFDVRVREVEIAGIDLEFLSGYVLESVKRRMDQSLKGICTFEYVGELKDHSRALRVTVNPRKLIPALSDLHVVDVDVRDREFLFKVGRVE
jgi:hypothetical protein